MNLERDLQPFLIESWTTLGIGKPPDRLSTMLIKGNRKSVFCVFEGSRNTPSAVVKFAGNRDDWYRLRNEKATIDCLSDWVPELSGQFLAPCIVQEVGAGLAFVRKASPGRSLSMKIRPAAPDGQPTIDRDDVSRAFSWLLDLQHKTQHHVRRAADPRESVAKLRQSHPCLKSLDEAHPAYRNVLSAIVDGRLGLTVEHGDYNPDNLFEHRGRLTVIDWEWGRIPGMPLVDLYEFAIQCCKASSIQGITRSRKIEEKDALTAFGKNDFADHVRSWIREAGRRLGIPVDLRRDLLALHLSRYFSGPHLESLVNALILRGQRD